MGTFATPHQAPNYLAEVFYFVPLLCALQLQRSGEYVAALDWFQTVYAYHLPPGRLDEAARRHPAGGQTAARPAADLLRPHARRADSERSFSGPGTGHGKA